MTSDEIKAVCWLFNPPVLLNHATRQYPVDNDLKVLAQYPLPLHAIPVIRSRALRYAKAGCPKDACVKAALRDYLADKIS